MGVFIYLNSITVIKWWVGLKQKYILINLSYGSKIFQSWMYAMGAQTSENQ